MVYKVYYKDSVFSTHPEGLVGDREAHANLGFLYGRQPEPVEMHIHKGVFTESAYSTVFLSGGSLLRDSIAFVRLEKE